MFGKRETPPDVAQAQPGVPPPPVLADDDAPPWGSRYATAANNVILGIGDHLVRTLNEGPGARPETLMAASGALVGYAALHAAFDRARLGFGELNEVRTADGATYILGDGVNVFIAPGDPAVPAAWNYIAGGLTRVGAPVSELPDLVEIFAHVGQTLGTAEFGRVRSPQGYRIEVTVQQMAPAWQTAKRLLSRPEGSKPETGLPSLYWPSVLGVVCQHNVFMVRDMLHPRLAAAICAEAAAAASAIDQRRKPANRS